MKRILRRQRSTVIESLSAIIYTAGDKIRLEYVVNGAVSATVITSTQSIPNNLTDIGFLVRVTRSSAGVFQLFTSPLPTAIGTGAVATDVPNTVNANINQGTGTNNSLVPAANGYLGLAASNSTSADARNTAEFDQIYLTPDSTTAASAAINGRITDSRGRGLNHVIITITGGVLESPIYVQTNTFGYYRFNDISVGNTYIITPFSKRYIFEQSSFVVNVNGDFDGADFVGQRRFSVINELENTGNPK